MNLWVFSDLHERQSFELPFVPSDVDVIVVAGDIADGFEATERWLQSLAQATDIPIILVPGNHEFVGGDYGDVAAFARDASTGSVHVLADGRAVVLGGVRFVGATLWTDYAIADDVLAARSWAKANMPDFRDIDLGMRRLRPQDVEAAHHQQLDAIRLALAQPFEGPTVVVTHHAPHPGSLRAGKADHPGDASFASDLTQLIEGTQPELWVHGHVHQSRNYMVGTTRVVCNPRGYVQGPDGGNPDFDPALTITI